MEKTYNWAILGAGHIANKFAEGLKILPNARRYAIAARSLERAEVFRQNHGFEKAYGSYEEMVKDPNIDAVYISTTNNLHFEHTLLCLEAGKAVLCEKPFASNLAQVEKMIATAREKNVFLMEALWSRFLPSMIQFKQEVENESIGKPSLLQCDFGYISPFSPHSRLYDPALGGGSVPDIGIYPIFVAMYLFGYPTEIKVSSIPSPTGTDWTTAILFKHSGGEISMLSSSFAAVLSNESRLYGSNGQLKLHKMFHMITRLTVSRNNEQETEIPTPSAGNGYNYEAAEVMTCLDKGLVESPGMSWQFSLDLIKLIDTVSALAAKAK
ncbi:oxidoreductase [Bacteroidia bacterium]|nr:oxidoreductase [Bacteroidia bacterium]